MIQERPLTSQEVADYLSLSNEYVRRLARQGKIESYKVGNQFRFTKEHVFDYITKDKDNER